MRLFLFFMPLLVLAVGLLGFVRSWFSTSDVQDTVQLSGVIGSQLDSALQQPNASRWAAVAAGLVGVVLTGRTLSKVLVAASCLAWRIPVQTKVPMRLVGSLIGLMTAVGFVTLLVNRVRDAAGFGLASVSLGAAALIYTGIWVVLCLPLPRVTPDPGSLFPGAALIALTMVGMQAVSQLYLPQQFSQASELYGAIGTTIVTLGWFFVLGRGIMLALVLNAAVYERVGSITGALFSLPILRLLPRRIRSVASHARRGVPGARGAATTRSVRETADAVAEQLGAEDEQHDHHDDGVVLGHEVLDRVEGTRCLACGEEVEQHRTGHGQRADHDEDGDRHGGLATARGRPGRSMAAAASVSARFFGLTPDSAAPSTSDLPGGERVDGGHPLRHRRLDARPAGACATGLSAITRNSSAEQQLDPVDRRRRAGVGVVGVAGQRAARCTLTTTRPITHPTANAGPFVRAFGVPSMRITAMIGTGLSATPIADGRRSPIA